MQSINKFCGLDRTYGYLALEFLLHDSRPTLMLGLSDHLPPSNVEYTFLFANDAFLRVKELNTHNMYSMYANTIGSCARIGNWITRISYIRGPSGGVAVVTASQVEANPATSQIHGLAHPSTTDIVGVWGKVSSKSMQVDGDTQKLAAVQPEPEDELNGLEILEDDVRRAYRPSLNEFELAGEEPSSSDESTEKKDRQMIVSTSGDQVNREEQKRTPMIDWRIQSDHDDSPHFQNLRRVDW
jgi:hypothetical protein